MNLSALLMGLGLLGNGLQPHIDAQLYWTEPVIFGTNSGSIIFEPYPPRYTFLTLSNVECISIGGFNVFHFTDKDWETIRLGFLEVITNAARVTFSGTNEWAKQHQVKE